METMRDQRSLPWLETIAHDVRYALRLVVHQPRFSLIVILTIALATSLATSLGGTLPDMTTGWLQTNATRFGEGSDARYNYVQGTLKLTMQEAGAPLTPEQEPQIQAFYNEDAQQRQQLQREAQGRPDPAKLADLEKATMAKVVKILTPAQRKALLDSRTKQ